MTGITDTLHLCLMKMLNDTFVLRATITNHCTAVTAMMLPVEERERGPTDLAGTVERCEE
jgi:hypothetical protein